MGGLWSCTCLLRYVPIDAYSLLSHASPDSKIKQRPHHSSFEIIKIVLIIRYSPHLIFIPTNRPAHIFADYIRFHKLLVAVGNVICFYHI